MTVICPAFEYYRLTLKSKHHITIQENRHGL